MPVASNARTARLLERLPRPTGFAALEMLLLILLAIQCARFFWVLVTPVGPVGDWKSPAALAPPPASPDSLAQFDPFFRLSGDSGPATVTALDLKLFGVREDRATGRGSAIIGLPDGAQASYSVGEEIMPGVTLAAVAFDSVTLTRNGAPEQLFLDQSAPAENAAPAEPGPSVNFAPQNAPAPAPAGGAPLSFQPRTSGGRVTGLIVQPGANPEVFRAAGFQNGDVVVSINNQRVSSAEQAGSLIAGQQSVSLVVDRGGRAVPLRVRLVP